MNMLLPTSNQNNAGNFAAMAPQMAPPESPAPSTTPLQNQSVVSTPPHPSPSPHMSPSPVPQNQQIVVTSQHQQTPIQFSQGVVSSVSGGVVQQQQPQMIQTMAQGSIQFPPQLLQQGQLNPGTYLQPLYQTTGQQQMLLSSPGGITLQPALNQSITVVPNPQQKITTTADGKQLIGTGQIKGPAQVITNQGNNNAGKMQSIAQRNQQNTQIVTNQAGQQIITGHHQYVQQGPNGQQTLVISPMNMLPQGTMVHQTIQQGAKGAQQKFIGTQKGPNQLHITNMQGSQYRHINPNSGQQLITAGGQSVLSQPQLLSSLQAFNTYPGISWAGSLQGNTLLQPQILIRNQADGSVYLQSQQQQLQQPMNQQLSSVPLPNVVHSVGQPTLVSSTSINQANTSLQLQSTASSPQQQQQQQQQHQQQQQQQQQQHQHQQQQQQHQQQQQQHHQQQLQQQINIPSSQANQITIQQGNQNMSTTIPLPILPNAARMGRPPNQPHFQNMTGLKPVAPGLPRVMPRGLSARPSTVPSPQQSCEVKAEDKSKRDDNVSDQAMPNVEPVAMDAPSLALPVATVQPLESGEVSPMPQRVTVVTLPDLPEPQASTSPAVAAPFPTEATQQEEMEEASEILTHVIDGYIIREGPTPFPVGRNALLTEMLRREHETLFGGRERKRKENNGVKEACEDGNAKEPMEEGHRATPDIQKPAAAILATAASPLVSPTIEREMKAVSPRVASVEPPQTFRDPKLWNVQEVYDFINSIAGCSAYAEEFRAQEIDGEALLILKEESFAKIKNMKLGPAAKICMRLDNLKTE